MTWAAILSGFLRLFGAVADYLRDRQLLKAGEAKAEGEQAKANSDALADLAKIERDVGAMSDEQLRDELRRWGEKGSGN